MYDFLLGDILIFKAEEDWISKAIAWVTDSDVSHAAMIYRDGVMVEMGLDGIMRSKLQEGIGESAYRLRLEPPQSALPLLKATDVYLDCKTRYDVPALVLLGALLIYRHIRPSTKLYQIVDMIVNLACLELDRLINQLLKRSGSMVCSQLVYQIYQDCGGPYQLQLCGGLLQNDVHSGICLAELAASCEQVPAMPSLERSTAFALEDLCRELLEAADAPENSAPPLPLLHAVSQLSAQLRQFAQLAGVPMEALLVTPADLAYHMKNLRRVDTVLVQRGDLC